MIGALQKTVDRFLGRGEASISIPPFDGALKPNRRLEEAPVFAELEAPEDLATDGQALLVADGQSVRRYARGAADEVARFDRPVTALCCLADGGLAVALEGRALRICGGAHDGKSWDRVAGTPLNAVNAIHQAADGRLLVTDGSQTQSCENWCHDLMTLGRSGRLVAIDLARGDGIEIASGLAYAFGACATGSEVWVSESWRHRLVSFGPAGRGKPILESLPAYPSRLAPATGGGFWLTAFIARTQLVEFVLREPAYRRRMIKEIDPRYWVAPKLSSDNTYLEPMQGAHIKTMGILKPWAPPRSYGLVIRLTAEGLPRYSLHSRVDGTNHGVVAAVECGGELFVLAKGRRRILRLPVAGLEEGLHS